MKGTFTNTVKTEWLPNGREMVLLEDVTYIDSKGKRWEAKAGDIIDGASIPRFFWRVIGSPFVGKYRRSSVIHDVYCKNKTEESVAVHAMFLEAMETDGVTKIKRKAMWSAVRCCGPRFHAGAE